MAKTSAFINFKASTLTLYICVSDMHVIYFHFLVQIQEGDVGEHLYSIISDCSLPVRCLITCVVFALLEVCECTIYAELFSSLNLHHLVNSQKMSFWKFLRGSPKHCL